MDIAAERAYPTPFSNSPLLPLLLMYLATQRNTPKQAKTIRTEYDYIVVGGGSAGSVVASRLSEEPCVSVLLLEAGGKPPLLSDVPALSKFFWGTDIDWQYKTVPQKNAAYFLENNQVTWPSGKGLGGSSLLNAMLYVRGNRKDYDNWAAHGAKGWSYKDVFPYFLKLEDNKDPEFLKNGYHSTGGPITAEKPRYQSEIKNPIREAAHQMGYKVLDSNAAHQTGFDDFQANIRNQQRCSTAKAYLVPAENRKNLDIVGGAHVKKILFKGKRAVGVQFDYQNKEHKIQARREVILSAGTTNTAQLLMISGIGPRKHLEEFKIPVIIDLPVGDNFHDQCGFPMLLTLASKPLDISDSHNINEYVNNRTGPLTAPQLLTSIAFLGSQDVSSDDLPLYELYIGELDKSQAKQIGLNPSLHNVMVGPHENQRILQCVSQLLQPKSRGTVRLQSNNSYDPPLIDPNYYEDPSDVEAVVKGMKTCFMIALSTPMKNVRVRPLEIFFPEFLNFFPEILLDRYFSYLARGLPITLSHHVGTAKMGDPKDPTTVVDPELRVKGIQGLRVVDASIMPIVPTGNINIPTIMVAEKASDIIKQTISCSSQ